MRPLIAVFIGLIYLITVLLLFFVYRRRHRNLLILIEGASFAVISFVLLVVFLLAVLAQIELGRAVAGSMTGGPAISTGPTLAVATSAALQATSALPASPTSRAAPSPTRTPTVALPPAKPTRRQPSVTAAPAEAPVTPTPEPTPTPVSPPNDPPTPVPPPNDPPAPNAEATPTPVVITTTVSFVGGLVRSSPGIGDNIIGTVHQGDELIVLGASDEWYLVRLGQTRSESSNIAGDQGWIARDLVNPPSQPPPLITP